MNIPVIYEDDWLLVVDKPPGLLTIPAARSRKRTLTGILNDDARAGGAAYRLHPCHRLDRETSGVIIYAKGKAVQKRMMELFKKRAVAKRYRAFVQGRLRRSRGRISRAVDGREAVTEYRVLRSCKQFSVLSIAPLTGRKNQIRIHLKSLGHPLVGETRFAFRKDFPLRAQRVCLHAESVSFRHPVEGRRLSLRAALSADMQRFLKKHTE